MKKNFKNLKSFKLFAFQLYTKKFKNSETGSIQGACFPIIYPQISLKISYFERNLKYLRLLLSKYIPQKNSKALYFEKFKNLKVLAFFLYILKKIQLSYVLAFHFFYFQKTFI